MGSNIDNSQTSGSKVKGEQSAIRKYIWPIENHEISKFLFITLLMFCVLFIQNLIRAQKDSIVNTMVGTEIIAFLKFWGVVPAAVGMAILYVKLINKFKGEHVFYMIISGFLAFFVLFAFFIFPNHEALHMSREYSDYLISTYPNFKWFILIFSKWGFSLFYIMAELWPNLAFSLLFWQFTNSVTTVDESIRFYPLFGLFGQTGLVFAGLFLENTSNVNNYLVKNWGFDGSNSKVLSVQTTLSLVIILAIAALFVFWYINNRILKHTDINLKAKKTKMSIKESFSLVMNSRYIRLIALLLLCYGMAINLVEVPWKNQITLIYPDEESYKIRFGGYLKYTGCLTILLVIIGSNLVRFIGWKSAAIITPLMVFITGMGFFGITNFDIILGMFGLSLLNPATLAITMGAIQNVASKSTKYTLFDSTKEMAYVPLSDELKTKGKAAVDVIGIKLGKSISALVQMIIFTIFPAATYTSISVYLMILFSVICMVWLWAVNALSHEYKRTVARKKAESLRDL
jgi:AAA family ATP:ADP antiporter